MKSGFYVAILSLVAISLSFAQPANQLDDFKEVMERFLTIMNVTENHRILLNCIHQFMPSQWEESYGRFRTIDWKQQVRVAGAYRHFANVTARTLATMKRCETMGELTGIINVMRPRISSVTWFFTRARVNSARLAEMLQEYAASWAAKNFTGVGEAVGNVTKWFFFSSRMD